ncbi:MAG TPA: YbhN family protein [Solirubrobacterales bacterium]|nr:YbhN family protein [Solirubrobacterales bacterium]
MPDRAHRRRAEEEAEASDTAAIRPAALSRRLARIALWTGGVALTIFVLDLLGVPAGDWIRELFRKIGDIPPWAVAGGIVLGTAQTSLAALAWFGILRAALPRAKIPYRLVLACYAVAVALNGFLPANLGTWVMLLMFTTLIAGATFAMVFSGLLVQKIPFSVFNVCLYLYLFLTVRGSFSIKLGFLADHTGLVVLIVVGALVLLALLGRIFWRRLEGLRKQMLSGGAILRSPRKTLTDLVLPELGSYVARLAIVAVFLGAYGIPVSFHNVATVTASNSISNSVSATPGGVGVTQAMNSAALSGSTSASTATAYSIGQQLVISAWNVIFAVIIVSWVFGWSGGKELVESSYEDAKVKSRELKDKRKSRKEARD